MQLRQLRVFLKVLEEGSFGRAALELDMSQPAVSQAIQGLEHDLGVRLLERGRFGARATEVGERIVAQARVLLQLESALEQEVALARGSVRGDLTLAVFESFEKHVLPGLLTRLRERYPEVQVRLVRVPETLEGYTTALTDGTVQVAFGAWQIPPMCIGWVLMRDRHLVLLPLTSPVSSEELDYADLEDMPLVLVADSECTTRLLAHLRAEGRDVGATLVAHGSEAVIEMVAQGLGAAVLPELAAGSLRDSVRTLPFKGLIRPINVVMPPHSLKVPVVRAFLRVVKERFHDSELPLFSLEGEVEPLDFASN